MVAEALLSGKAEQGTTEISAEVWQWAKLLLLDVTLLHWPLSRSRKE
jgi:hypothetical protein